MELRLWPPPEMRPRPLPPLRARSAGSPSDEGAPLLAACPRVRGSRRGRASRARGPCLESLRLHGMPRRRPPQLLPARRRARAARPPRLSHRRPRSARGRAGGVEIPSCACTGCIRGGRGPPLPVARGGGLPARGGSDAREPHGAPDGPGVQHHHDAARAQRVPRAAAGQPADVRAQAARGARRPGDRARVHEGRDPGDVPEPHLLRTRRAGHRGGLAPLLRRAGARARASRRRPRWRRCPRRPPTTIPGAGPSTRRRAATW